MISLLFKSHNSTWLGDSSDDIANKLPNKLLLLSGLIVLLLLVILLLLLVVLVLVVVDVKLLFENIEDDNKDEHFPRDIEFVSIFDIVSNLSWWIFHIFTVPSLPWLTSPCCVACNDNTPPSAWAICDWIHFFSSIFHNLSSPSPDLVY